MQNRLMLLAAILGGMTGFAMAQGDSAAAAAGKAATDMGLSRAQVLADLENWHRAGLSFWPAPSSEIDRESFGDYRAALARYEQLRAGQTRRESVVQYQDMPRQ